MADEYTPTTAIIRDCYVYTDQQYDGSVANPVHIAVAEFDRWLAAHDREVRAEAWDEGYQFGRIIQADAMIADGHMPFPHGESIRSSLARNLADQFGTYRDNPHRETGGSN